MGLLPCNMIVLRLLRSHVAVRTGSAGHRAFVCFTPWPRQECWEAAQYASALRLSPCSDLRCREDKHHCADRVLESDNVIAYIQHTSLHPLTINNLPRYV